LQGSNSAAATSKASGSGVFLIQSGVDDCGTEPTADEEGIEMSKAKRTTMAKLTRERELKEKRELKQERKEQKKLAAEAAAGAEAETTADELTQIHLEGDAAAAAGSKA
jgi:hypothetical protein